MSLVPAAPASSDPPLRSGRWLMLACAGLIALCLTGAGLATWHMRREALARYQQTETNLGFALAEQTARTIQSIDLALQLVRSQVLAAGIVNAAEFDASLANQSMVEALRNRLTNLPQVAGITLVDADGHVVVTSNGLPEQTDDVSAREFFAWFRDHKADVAFISPPVQAGLLKRWTFYVVRRVAAPDGSTIGFVGGALSLSYFEELYRAVARDEATAINLTRGDGTILVRYPDFPKYVGRQIPRGSAWHGVAAAGGGMYRSKGDLTGDPHWVSVHPLPSFDLAVDVSFSEAAALGTWRRQAVAIGIVTTAIILILVLLFRALLTQFRRLALSEASLAQRNHEHEAVRARLESQAEELRCSQADAAEKSGTLQTTLEFMDQGIMMVDADRRVAVCNAHAMQMLDLPVALMAGRPHFTDVLAHQWQTQEFALTPERLQAFIRSGGILDQPHVYERRRPNGSVLEIRSAPLPGGGVVRTYTDVTERKAAEERVTAAHAQAEAARAAAEQANRAKTDFLTNISHEIRTPMNGIIGMNELLLRSELSDTQRDCALTVRDSAAALLRVIDDVLDIAKLEAGKIELDPSDFDLGETIEATAALLAPRAKEKGLALTTRLEPGTRQRFHADAIRLRQVLLNLLGNAIKFTEHGSVTVTARLLPEPLPDRGRRVEIEVADTGIGISEASRDRLFHKFTQADSSISRRFGGTGLGLAITRELLTLMGGTIAVSSTQGQGSRFSVALPLAPARASQGSTDDQTPMDSALPGQSLRVLVADDNGVNQRLVTALLQAIGHTAEVVSNGREAVEAVLRGRFDVVLMDVQMPVMDGVRATRRIRALPPPANAVPIIALTADAVSGAEERYRGAGMDGYLSKPLSPDTLAATLDAIVRGDRPEAPVPTVDQGAISGLRGFLDGAQFTAFIAESLRDLAALIERLGAWLAAGDLAQAAREAHDLVSVAGNCGACAVSSLARAVEQAARRDDAAEADTLFAQIRGAGGRATEALEELLG
ncbi:MAG TPA: ATP-binding protein [Acetobacteraceae bacterium]|nr:ATP-binding protein [Acetobacteraceae bacterium]